MTLVNPFESTGAGYKALFEAHKENFQNIGEAIGSVFDGDWSSVKGNLSELKLPGYEQLKAIKENLEEQEAEGKMGLLKLISTKLKEKFANTTKS